MTTVWEKEKIDNIQSEEAKLHNEAIRERYKMLQNAEEAQLSEMFAATRESEQNVTTTPVSHNEFVTPTASNQVQIGQENVTTQQKNLFTADTLRRIISDNTEAAASATTAAANETYVQTPIVINQRKNEIAEEVKAEVEGYSLTSAAKAVLAAFATLVVLLLTVIGINTRIMNARDAELISLESQRAELIEQSRELAAQIENATSEETIAEWAAQNGWSKLVK